LPENDFIKAIEHFFCVYIASSKHSGAGRILESYANPVYNPPRVKMRLCKHGKSALLLKFSLKVYFGNKVVFQKVKSAKHSTST